ncbi:hypothetical protein F443_23260 [Phytophthora nicotianae P1569]|uniref:Uncharacterized protein n=1 Tax=Phytophthora nicotianae P1569 TaxID=1317065 RepID=V9DRU0_PHYNI|nr:hypothetical protein F443_23260 [Phytophthora nicotianae P1569]
MITPPTSRVSPLRTDSRQGQGHVWIDKRIMWARVTKTTRRRRRRSCEGPSTASTEAVYEVTADETEGVYKDSDDGEASAKGDERVWRLQGRDVIGWQDRLKSVQPVSGPAGGWLQLHYRKWRRRRTSGKSGHCETYADESTVEGVSCEAIRHKKSAIVGLEIAQKTDNLTQSQ